MSDINLVKISVNNLLQDSVKAYAIFKENKIYNKETYEKLLKKYADTVSEIDKLRKEIGSSSLPGKDEVEGVRAMMKLMGCAKPDGSLDIEKLTELGKAANQGNS